MATAGLRFEPSRELLSQAIVESLRSWPEFQRRVFIEIHYLGRSVDDVSRVLGLQRKEITQILDYCERKLHRALKTFRGQQTAGEVSEEPPHPLARAAGCFL